MLFQTREFSFLAFSTKCGFLGLPRVLCALCRHTAAIPEMPSVLSSSRHAVPVPPCRFSCLEPLGVLSKSPRNDIREQICLTYASPCNINSFPQSNLFIPGRCHDTADPEGLSLPFPPVACFLHSFLFFCFGSERADGEGACVFQSWRPTHTQG